MQVVSPERSTVLMGPIAVQSRAGLVEMQARTCIGRNSLEGPWGNRQLDMLSWGFMWFHGVHFYVPYIHCFEDPPTFNNNNSNSNIRFQSLAWLRGKLVSAEEEPFQSQSHSRQKALSNFRKEGWIYKT